jgi:hypothetical protein
MNEGIYPLDVRINRRIVWARRYDRGKSMSDKGWVGRALAAGGVRAVAFYVTTTYIIPLGAPVATVAIGYASGVPWFVIWLGALAAFAFASTGLLRFTEWRFRQKVHDKLAFAGVMIGKDIRTDGIIIGLRLHNSALLSVEYRLEKILRGWVTKCHQRLLMTARAPI